MITVKEAAERTGLSTMTIGRAVSIANGNRHSHGRARMPGLRSTRKSYNSPTMIRLGDLKRWLRARAGYRQNGLKKAKRPTGKITTNDEAQT